MKHVNKPYLWPFFQFVIVMMSSVCMKLYRIISRKQVVYTQSKIHRGKHQREGRWVVSKKNRRVTHLPEPVETSLLRTIAKVG